MLDTNPEGLVVTYELYVYLDIIYKTCCIFAKTREKDKLCLSGVTMAMFLGLRLHKCLCVCVGL